MVNAWYIKNPPWKQLNAALNNADHLAENWPSREAQCREIVGWRMQLVPYLLSAFHRYAADGVPPFRALTLDYPDEESLRSVDDEYMVGDRMLVAPLFAGEAGRTITLPSGDWQDFWTVRPVREGTRFTVPASTEKIPVFVKAGSILPVAAVGASTESPQSPELTVRVYGDGHLPWRIVGGGSELELDMGQRGEGRPRAAERRREMAVSHIRVGADEVNGRISALFYRVCRIAIRSDFSNAGWKRICASDRHDTASVTVSRK